MNRNTWTNLIILSWVISLFIFPLVAVSYWFLIGLMIIAKFKFDEREAVLRAELKRYKDKYPESLQDLT